jgi:small subunit ribosomal protein S8
MMTDPIADLLTRVRNANRNGSKSVSMPASKLKVNLAAVLQDEGFLAGFRVEEKQPSSELTLDLRYGPDGEPVIRSIDRISKPGRRVYIASKEIAAPLRGLGIYVLSTPKGVLSDRRAREENVGGEVLCKVY